MDGMTIYKSKGITSSKRQPFSVFLGFLNKEEETEETDDVPESLD